MNPGFELLMLIAVSRIERRDRRLVARVVGLGSGGVGAGSEVA